MSNEEQLGLWSEFKDNLSEGIKRQESLIANLHEKMDVLMVRTSAMSDNLTTLPSSLLSTSAAAEATLRFPTSLISIELLLWLQRMLAEGSAISSGLRNVNVWLGDSGATFENATFVPIGPKRVPGDLKTLLDGWRSNYSRYIMYDESSKVRVIAEFHYEFLRIHPFLDGNGRVARAILQQQIKELLDKDVRSVFTDDPKNYYEALSKANEGDLEPLLALVQSVIE